MGKVLYSGSGKEASFLSGGCIFATKVVMKTRCNGFTCDIQIVLKIKSHFFFNKTFPFWNWKQGHTRKTHFAKDDAVKAVSQKIHDHHRDTQTCWLVMSFADVNIHLPHNMLPGLCFGALGVKMMGGWGQGRQQNGATEGLNGHTQEPEDNGSIPFTYADWWSEPQWLTVIPTMTRPFTLKLRIVSFCQAWHTPDCWRSRNGQVRVTVMGTATESTTPTCLCLCVPFGCALKFGIPLYGVSFVSCLYYPAVIAWLTPWSSLLFKFATNVYFERFKLKTRGQNSEHVWNRFFSTLCMPADCTHLLQGQP